MLRRVLTALLAACAGVLALLVVGPPAHAAPVTLTNPIDFTGTNGDPVDAHGGGVIKRNGYYYWFGENRHSDDTFKAVSVYKSSDLRTWEWVGDALNEASDPELESAKIERPKVIYNSTTKKFVMWMHKENATDYLEARAAVAVSDTIEGPYDYQSSFRPPSGTESRDMTLFVDKDANGNETAYHATAAKDNADLRIYKLNSAFTGYDTNYKVKEEVALVANPWPGQYRESPALFKRDGVYFMLTSGTRGWNPNQQKYATSTSLSTGWSEMKDVGNDIAYDSQTTFVLPIQGTSGTSYLYMGDRWAGADIRGRRPVNESTYVWLPLTFPTKTAMNLPWYPQVEIDTAAGTVKGMGGGPYYNLVARHSNKCVDVKDNSSADHNTSADAPDTQKAPVVQFTCNDGLNQQWRLEGAGDGYYRILAQHSGKCLDVEHASTADEAFVNQYSCGSGQNQQWKFDDQGNGYYRLVARHSGKCLDVPAGSKNDIVRLIQYTCGTGTNQQFTRPKV
ncbi:RICIN domain-containing protein [Streptomyces mirabilis]|uniref:RICIN domain-containing protein n=1 Tax=Streptomyces mirabilis TaxID=68239 RepID=UPI003D9E43E7